MVRINDHESIVSIDDDELQSRQVEGDDIMILALLRQTKRLSVTPSKRSN